MKENSNPKIASKLKYATIKAKKKYPRYPSKKLSQDSN